MKSRLLILFLVFAHHFLLAQNISGFIKDGKGNPIPSMTIINSTTNAGVTTDQNGNFTISAKENEKLKISYIGYQDMEVSVTDNDVYQITIDENADSQQKVVVVAYKSIIDILPDDLKEYGSVKRLKQKRDTYINVYLDKRIVDLISIMKKDGLTEAKIKEERELVEKEFDEKMSKVNIKYLQGIETLAFAAQYKQWLPVRDRITGIRYYNSKLLKEFSMFNNNSISAWDNNGSASTEIISGFLGPFRIDFSTILSRNKAKVIDPSELDSLDRKEVRTLLTSIDSTNKANSTLLKVASGGGEGVLNIKFPLINTKQSVNVSQFSYSCEIQGSLNADLPVAGSYIDKKDASVFQMLKLENKIIIQILDRSDSRRFDLIMKGTGGRVGGSSQFFDNLGIKDGAFWMIDYMVGFRIDSVNIYFTNQGYSHSDLKGKIPGRIGLSLSLN